MSFIEIWNAQCSVLRDLERREIIDARSYVLNEVSESSYSTSAFGTECRLMQVPLEIVSSSKSRLTGSEPRSSDDTLLSIWWNKYEVRFNWCQKILVLIRYSGGAETCRYTYGKSNCG